MNYMITKRYSILDSSAIASAAIFVALGLFPQAFGAFVIGMLISVLADHFYGNRAKDREWKELLNSDKKVLAIKAHRKLYGSSLYDALEVMKKHRPDLFR